MKIDYIHVLLLVIVGGLIYYGFFYKPEKLQTNYSRKIDSVENIISKDEQRIDSLKKYVVNLKDSINHYDSLIIEKEQTIKDIQDEKRQEITSVDTFNTSQLQRYFSTNYPER